MQLRDHLDLVHARLERNFTVERPVDPGGREGRGAIRRLVDQPDLVDETKGRCVQDRHDVARIFQLHKISVRPLGNFLDGSVHFPSHRIPSQGEAVDADSPGLRQFRGPQRHPRRLVAVVGQPRLSVGQKLDHLPSRVRRFRGKPDPGFRGEFEDCPADAGREIRGPQGSDLRQLREFPVHGLVVTRERAHDLGIAQGQRKDGRRRGVEVAIVGTQVEVLITGEGDDPHPDSLASAVVGQPLENLDETAGSLRLGFQDRVASPPGVVEFSVAADVGLGEFTGRGGNVDDQNDVVAAVGTQRRGDPRDRKDRVVVLIDFQSGVRTEPDEIDRGPEPEDRAHRAPDVSRQGTSPTEADVDPPGAGFSTLVPAVGGFLDEFVTGVQGVRRIGASRSRSAKGSGRKPTQQQQQQQRAENSHDGPHPIPLDRIAGVQRGNQPTGRSGSRDLLD